MGQTPSQLTILEGLSDSQIGELKKLQSGSDLPPELSSSLPSGLPDENEDESALSGEQSLRGELHKNGSENRAKTSVSASGVWGRDIFSAENLTFAPSVKIPTPMNYIVASGDELIASLWGESEAEYILRVSPEGNVSIPRIGLVNIGSLTIEEAEKKIKAKLSKVISGLSTGTVNLKITLGDFRSITVNIIGEAQMPGTYTLPSLATAFNGLYAAAGVSDIGSLRDIKLYRKGKLVAELDVYEYLMQGGDYNDMRLEDNDLIIVSPYKNLVVVEGGVKRPKIYEMAQGETIADLLDYAGGFRGDAFSQTITMHRRSGDRQYSISTVARENFDEFPLMDRDVLRVGYISDGYANRVSVEGAVWREGYYELSDSVATLSSLIEVAGSVTSDAFEGRGQIFRTRLDGTMEILSFSLEDILSGRGEDIVLFSEDRVVIASKQGLREGATLTIAGEVNSPKTVGYVEGMTIKDFIVLSGGFKNSASLERVEVARRIRDPYAIEAGEERAELFVFNIDEDLGLESHGEDFVLMPYDMVFVRRSPSYVEQRIVEAVGEFNFSGDYAISSSDYRLSDLVSAAGGLTSMAYVKGATLRRLYTPQDLRRAESLKALKDVSEKQGIGVETSGVGQAGELSLGDYYTVGIDLSSALRDSLSSANIVLRAGDKLLVPCRQNTITISGAVYYSTTTTHVAGLRVRDYVRRAGGYSTKARRRPFVIEPSGNVLAVKGSYVPSPGSQIVVPYREYREPMSVQGWVGISSSIVSMAAMVMSLLN